LLLDHFEAITPLQAVAIGGLHRPADCQAVNDLSDDHIWS
jgi:hypothetical protein